MSIYDYKNLSAEQRSVNKTIAILENSQRHRANLEVAEKAAFEKQKADTENEKIMDGILAENERQKEIEEKQLRETSAKNLEIMLREKFFRTTENGLESDFQKLLPKLKEEYFLERMNGESSSEQLIRQSGNYSKM